jgi:hypothetical protein
MATTVIRDVGVYIDGYDFSGKMQQADVTLDLELHDETTFRTNGTRAMRGGLINNKISMKGFVDFDEINAGAEDSLDLKMFTDIGIDTPIGSICPEGVDIGDPALLAEWVHANYSPGAEVGALLMFTINAEGRSRATRGNVLNAALTAVTGAGNSASKTQVGAITSDMQGVAHLHVVFIDGGTLTVSLRSDANGAAGGETVRHAFAGFTDVGSERALIPGAITDAFWDASWTFSGTSCLFLVTFGVEDLSL